jgi:uncharacterized protein YciI
MKFLIITKMRPTSVDVWAKLLPAHFKYLDGLEKKKAVEVSYHLIGHQGDVLVVNADSDEQLASIVGEDPLFFYTDREIYPLTTREVHKRRLKEIFGKTSARTRTS